MAIPTSNFECVKVAIKQDKSGYVLTLSIHPDDIPSEIMRDFVGSRYQVVMVRLNDDQTAYPREKKETDRTVAKAGVLCRSPEYWKWLESIGELMPDERNEDSAVEVMQRMLGIKSRAELRDNTKAQDAFGVMMAEYELWKSENDRPPF